ncbi:AAA family ATPase [Polaribacter sp. Asnod1-A03]|uniref:AAA family ATPase n=1 Tax=Polaribacter sp. Asnod1-A03 TaxID=3160581 RepID=UPI00386BE0B6
MIKEYRHRKTTYRLVDSNSSSENNIFSILVGKNGSGKSTLLGALTSDLIKEIKSRKEYYSNNENTFFENVNDDFFPKEIIAVSTSPFDKFPVNRMGRNIDGYTYLGLRDLYSTNFGLAYLSKIIASLVESVIREPRQSYEIGRVLKYLGYKSEIWIKFQIFNSRKFLDEIISMDDPMMIFETRRTGTIRKFNKSFFLNEDDSINEEKVYKLRDVALKIMEGNLYRSNFEFSLNENGLNIDMQESDDILFLIQSGIIRLKDVILQPLIDYSHFSIKDASSGEQSIILSILGIASKIKDNCLICIDEPEICLHPQWQEKYIEILISTFENYRNCHFIIATHSPQIISRLNNNSFIIDMESGESRNALEFINHSADFQLANIFDSPGFKNEYLSRIALNIFTKVSKRKMFDLDDLEKLRLLDKQSKNLNHNDPVYNLFEAIKELQKIYG